MRILLGWRNALYIRIKREVIQHVNVSLSLVTDIQPSLYNITIEGGEENILYRIE